MGNCYCAPRLQGQDLKNYLQRHLFPKRRKRKIEKLVKLAANGDDQNFKTVAGRIKLTKEELDYFYEERNAVVNEFNNDVIEIETYDYGHESPSEYGETDSDEYETDISECSTSREEYTPITPKFLNSRMQQMFEEYCQKEWAKRLGMVSLSDLPELEQYKDLLYEKSPTTRSNSGKGTRSEMISKNRVELLEDNNNTKRTDPKETARKSVDESLVDKSDKGSFENFQTRYSFDNCDGIKDNGKDIPAIANKHNRSDQVHEGQDNPVEINKIGITKGLKVGKGFTRKADLVNLKLSKSETKPGENIRKQKYLHHLEQQDGIANAEVTVGQILNNDKGTEGVKGIVSTNSKDVLEHVHKIDSNTVGVNDRVKNLVKRFRQIGNSSQSDSKVIHVKPASPETCFDNCRLE